MTFKAKTSRMWHYCNTKQTSSEAYLSFVTTNVSITI